ncbi:MAG: ACR3 family arsenite efflux transporter [Rubrivivax sp.]
MRLFERYLTVWVALAMMAGVGLGLLAPGAFAFIAAAEFAHVNFVVAELIWIMIFPMMVQVDWSAVRQAWRQPAGLGLTLVVNWLVKPFTMAAVAVLFFEHLYRPWVDPRTAQEIIAGMILLGVAPCTAMVFVWSQLVRGDAGYTLVQVAVNDLVMLVAFVPITVLLLGVSEIQVPWTTLLVSTALYVLLPLVLGVATRQGLLSRGPQALERFAMRARPWTIAALLATVVLLFGMQAQSVVQQPLLIGLIAVPLVLQTLGIFGLAWLGARVLALPRHVAGPACLIGTSNFFELAVAVAISLFGLHSAAALATVVGVLVEVPVMLALVWVVNRFMIER